MRVVALLVSPGTYKRPLKKFLNDFMAAHRDLSGLDVAGLEARFKRAAELLLDGPGSAALRPGGTAVNAALTEAVFVGLMRRLEISEPGTETVISATSALLTEPELPGVIERATADEDSVKRLALATKAFVQV